MLSFVNSDNTKKNRRLRRRGGLAGGGFFCHLDGFVGGYFCTKPKTKPMIHESKLFEIVQALKTFSLQWVSKKGELVTVDECTCTSFNSSGKTLNIKLASSGLIRKVNRKTITAINGKEVYL